MPGEPEVAPTPFDSRAQLDDCAGLSATEDPRSPCRIRHARSTAFHCAGAGPTRAVAA
ncbi:hypothetical protein ACFV0H_39195 [Streptomyces erythrochromogenes]|uniref:hypothetical protein n=1 Tax=Streptomyces erythrochromogenes TaxID=285574 RepID=UPI0036CCE32A